jgi:hypothetical protein
MIKYPPCQLVTASTSMKPTPHPSSPATQDTPPSDATTTALLETEGWRTVEGKATQRKKRTEEAGKKQVMEISNKPPMTKNSGWGKNSHQLWPTNSSANKIWADVIKGRGINIQIVVGNSNLGLTIPAKMRGERWGGAAWRLAKWGEEGERGVVGRGKGGPEEITSRGNKGRQKGKYGRGSEEDREEPSVVASKQTGLLDKITWNRPR